MCEVSRSPFLAPVSTLSAFVGACHQCRSGVLEVEVEGGAVHRVVLLRGRPMRIELAVSVAPLTELLPRWNDINLGLAQIIAPSPRADENEVARELLAARAITPARLKEVRRVQAMERLAFLFSLPVASLRFRDLEESHDVASGSSLVLPAHVYLDLARRPASTGLVDAYVARFASRTITLAPDVDLHSFGFSDAEASVAQCLGRTPASVIQLVDDGFDCRTVAIVAFALSLSEGLRFPSVSAPPRAASRPPPEGASARGAASSRRRRASTPVRTSRAPRRGSPPKPPSTFEALEEIEHLIERGDTYAAHDRAVAALANAPDLPDLRAYRVVLSAMLECDGQLGRLPKDHPCFAELSAIAAVAPSSVVTLHYRGELRRLRGDTAAAQEDFEAALRINPFHKPTRQALLEMNPRRTQPPPSEDPSPWYRRLLRKRRG